MRKDPRSDNSERGSSSFPATFQGGTVQLSMDANRGNTGQDISDLELAADRARRDYASATRWTSHCYSMLDRAIEDAEAKERVFDLAQRAVKLARHKTGAVVLAVAAVGLGDPIAALFG